MRRNAGGPYRRRQDPEPVKDGPVYKAWGPGSGAKVVIRSAGSSAAAARLFIRMRGSRLTPGAIFYVQKEGSREIFEFEHSTWGRA